MCAFPAPRVDLGFHEPSRLKVLVVDDYMDAAETLAEFITLNGHHALTAFDGASALHIASGWRPDLILMELTLPRISGIDACRRIKSTFWGQTTKVLAVTGWGGPARRAQSREAGFEGYMLKPIEFPELERVIEQLSRAKTPTDEPRPSVLATPGRAMAPIATASLPLLG